MSDETCDDTIAQLKAIANDGDEEINEQLTEEELQRALCSPIMELYKVNQHCEHDDDNQSTECADDCDDDDDDDDDDDEDDDNDDDDDADAVNDPKGSSKQGSALSKCSVRECPSPSACSTIGATRQEYQFQMQDHHIFKGKHGKKLYKCDVCFAVYRHSFSLKRHFIRSHINYVYLCETDVTNCGINLAASASLQQWYALQHKKKSYGKDSAQNNRENDDDGVMNDLYCCHSCVVFFDDINGLISHVDGWHRNTKSGTIEPVRIPCPECNMSFIQRHNLMRHIEVVHNGRKLYACKCCGKKFQTISDRKKHTKSQHKDMLEPQYSDDNGADDGDSERVESHHCSKCTITCDSYTALRRHVSKKHHECYHSCAFCAKFYYTKKQLSEHVRSHHGKTLKANGKQLKIMNIKSLASSFKIANGTVRSNRKSGSSINQNKHRLLQSLSAASESGSSTMTCITSNSSYFHCSLCYRRFLTYGSLIRHKQIAHRSQERIRSQTTSSNSNCSRLTRKTPSQIQMHSDLENIVPNSVLIDASEIEFYRTVAQRIAENLLHFVDGKFVNCRSQSSPSFDDNCIPHGHRHQHHRVSARMGNVQKNESQIELNLVNYNFPEGFSVSSAPLSPLNDDDKEKLGFLLECNLRTTPLECDALNDHCSGGESNVNGNESLPKSPMYMCSACHSRISPESFADHETNNHPNVCCNYLEIDPNCVPSQLMYHHHQNPEGLLRRCLVPSLLNSKHDTNDSVKLSDLSLKCTKCTNSFASVSQLHQHIVECAFKCKGSPTMTVINSKRQKKSPEIRNSSSVSLNDQSPPSPCKTRSGKRRQNPPDDQSPSKGSKTIRNSVASELRGNTSIEPHEEITVNEHNHHQRDDNNNDNNNPHPEILTDNKIGDIIVQTCRELSSDSIDSIMSLKNNKRNSPKRYGCSKCDKKFVFRDTLKKHQMSCLTRVRMIFKSKGGKKMKRLKTVKNLRIKNTLKVKLKTVFEAPLKNDIKLRTLKKQNSDKNILDNQLSTKCTTIVREELLDNDNNNINESKKLTNSWTPSLNKSLGSAKVDVSQSISGASGTGISGSLTPLQEHRCPDCLRVFTYMANFRKHIRNVCPVRRQLGDDASYEPIDHTPVASALTINIKQEKLESDYECDESIRTQSESMHNNENIVPIDDHDHDNDDHDDDDVQYEGEERVIKDNDDDDVTFLDAEQKNDESKLDLWRIKQEHPMYAFKGSPAQHHSCPYCQRGFTYLANYRKHIKTICPIRQQIEEKKRKVMEDATQDDDGTIRVKVEPQIPQVQYTPTSMSVRSQIEDTVLTMLRDQTKQNEIIRSSEELMLKQSATKDASSPSLEDNNNKNCAESDDNCEKTTDGSENSPQKSNKEASKGSSYRFRTFSCSICHKIFLSYVTMLKHRLSHKLTDGVTVNSDGTIINTTETDVSLSSASDSTQVLEMNQNKEVQNQMLAANLLKISKETIQRKFHSLDKRLSHATVNAKTIDTTELLETLARGGSGESEQIMNKIKNANDHVIVDSKKKITAAVPMNGPNPSTLNSNHSQLTNSSESIPEYIIETDNLDDYSLLKDGVFVVDDGDGVDNEKVVYDSVDIANGSEVWITFTTDGSDVIADSSAFVHVPNDTDNPIATNSECTINTSLINN